MPNISYDFYTIFFENDSEFEWACGQQLWFMYSYRNTNYMNWFAWKNAYNEFIVCCYYIL
jgi:hypothetical protein